MLFVLALLLTLKPQSHHRAVAQSGLLASWTWSGIEIAPSTYDTTRGWEELRGEALTSCLGFRAEQPLSSSVTSGTRPHIHSVGPEHRLRTLCSQWDMVLG